MLKVLLATAFMAVALSGCTGGESGSDDGPRVELNNAQVPVNDDAARSVPCGQSARLSVQGSGGDTGSFTVTVRSGSGVPTYDETFQASTNVDLDEDLAGPAGDWVLRVHRSLEHDGTFTVALTCL